MHIRKGVPGKVRVHREVEGTTQEHRQAQGPNGRWGEGKGMKTPDPIPEGHPVGRFREWEACQGKCEGLLKGVKSAQPSPRTPPRQKTLTSPRILSEGPGKSGRIKL